jgi:hypothetical protein
VVSLKSVQVGAVGAVVIHPLLMQLVHWLFSTTLYAKRSTDLNIMGMQDWGRRWLPL